MVYTLEVKDRVPNQPSLHHTPTHRTGLQKEPPLCLLGAHGTNCGESTTMFSVDKGKLGSPPLRHSHHRRSGKMRGTHSLPDAHPHHRHSRERQTFLWSTEAHNRCPQLWLAFSCESQFSPLPSKDSWNSLVCGCYLPWVCCFAHSNDTETIPTPVSGWTSWHHPSSDLCEFLGSVGLHGRSSQQLLEVLRRRGILHV